MKLMLLGKTSVRLTIWQQFSSNHSGIFSVVGTFATEVEARAASESAKDILRRLLPAVQAADRLAFSRVAWEIGIEWQDPPDWMISEIDIDQAVETVGRLVFISNPDQTWNQCAPYRSLLSMLGAEQVGGYDLDIIESDQPIMWVVMTVQCHLPDEGSAKELANWWLEIGKSSLWGVVTRTGTAIEIVNMPVDDERTPLLLETLARRNCTISSY
jgi:hypothetical protein